LGGCQPQLICLLLQALDNIQKACRNGQHCSQSSGQRKSKLVKGVWQLGVCECIINCCMDMLVYQRPMHTAVQQLLQQRHHQPGNDSLTFCHAHNM
jgi:hypothetical protein